MIAPCCLNGIGRPWFQCCDCNRIGFVRAIKVDVEWRPILSWSVRWLDWVVNLHLGRQDGGRLNGIACGGIWINDYSWLHNFHDSIFSSNCSHWTDSYSSLSLLARHQGCSQVRPHCWRCQEASPLSSRYCCSSWDQEVPEVYWLVDPQGKT